MAAPIALREDFGGLELRKLAKQTKDAAQARRLLALAEIDDGGPANLRKCHYGTSQKVVLKALSTEGPARDKSRLGSAEYAFRATSVRARIL